MFFRALLRPYLEAKYGVPYQHGMKSFPIDVHTPINNSPSKKSSTCNSFVSLYETTKEDSFNPKLVFRNFLFFLCECVSFSAFKLMLLP